MQSVLRVRLSVSSKGRGNAKRKVTDTEMSSRELEGDIMDEMGESIDCKASSMPGMVFAKAECVAWNLGSLSLFGIRMMLRGCSGIMVRRSSSLGKRFSALRWW